jgi:hypothetical protein
MIGWEYLIFLDPMSLAASIKSAAAFTFGLTAGFAGTTSAGDSPEPPAAIRWRGQYELGCPGPIRDELVDGSSFGSRSFSDR